MGSQAGTSFTCVIDHAKMSLMSENLPTLASDANISQIFDESIVLLSMLGPSNRPRIQRSDLKSGTSDSRTEWHLFLDQLAWLCDYRTGGKTVASIAAEEVVDGSKFWLASNAKSVSMASKHLKWVLQELQSLAIKPDLNTEDTQNRIFTKSVIFSHERVKFYIETLNTLIQHSRDLRRDDHAGQPLYQYLDKLVGYHQQHEKLCLSAFSFRGSPASKLLSERTGQSSVWAGVRHYIGRLGSWWKASKILTTTAQALPHLLQNVQVGTVRSWPVSTVPSIREEADIYGALNRLLPLYDASRLQQVQNSFQDRWGQDVAKEFEERYDRKKAKPCIHAELLMLGHFRRKNLSFVEDIRYIGCSKPSCYCCDLYMRLHPQDVLPRPCHGNTWVKWCMPIQTDSNNTAARAEMTNIMERMVQEMRCEILSNDFLGTTLKVSRRESTTGISTTVSS